MQFTGFLGGTLGKVGTVGGVDDAPRGVDQQAAVAREAVAAHFFKASTLCPDTGDEQETDNEADGEPEGEETFYIAYTLPFAEDYDLYLFTELINAVSGETVTTNFCRDFLRGLEIDLSPPRVRYTIISKSKPLDWDGHWIISYDLSSSDYSESYRQDLTFKGLTKAGF